MNNKKIYRSSENKIIFGVCGGLSEYFEVDPLLIRALFILLFFSGPGIFLYLILTILMPLEDKKNKKTIKETKVNGNWIKDARNIVGVLITIFGLNVLSSALLGINFLNWINWSIVGALIIIIIGIKMIKK